MWSGPGALPSMHLRSWFHTSSSKKGMVIFGIQCKKTTQLHKVLMGTAINIKTIEKRIQVISRLRFTIWKACPVFMQLNSFSNLFLYLCLAFRISFLKVWFTNLSTVKVLLPEGFVFLFQAIPYMGGNPGFGIWIFNYIFHWDGWFNTEVKSL